VWARNAIEWGKVECFVREITYRGYYGSVEGDDSHGYYGRVLYTCEELCYEGDDIASLYRSFAACVDRHIDIQQRIADCGLDVK